MTRSEILQIAKPILFNTDMVRAILDGRKTVTRRVIKCPQHKVYNAACARGKWYETYNPVDMPQYLIDWYAKEIAVPPYKPGDILYVRETWQRCYELDGNEQIIEDTGKYVYAASPKDMPQFTEWVRDDGTHTDVMPWRPSIHMPKEASRIFLWVKNVRVERLREITADGIRHEGLSSMAVHAGDMEIAQAEFKIIWNSTIPKKDLDKYGWDTNPWVWVIEFERIGVDE